MRTAYLYRDTMREKMDKKKRGPVGSTILVLLPTVIVDCVQLVWPFERNRKRRTRLEKIITGKKMTSQIERT